MNNNELTADALEELRRLAEISFKNGEEWFGCNWHALSTISTLEDRKFIAAANPSTIIALLDRITALEKSIKYEQHLAGRIGTHGPYCYSWGPSHYSCLERHCKELEDENRNKHEVNIQLVGQICDLSEKLRAGASAVREQCIQACEGERCINLENDQFDSGYSNAIDDCIAAIDAIPKGE